MAMSDRVPVNVPDGGWGWVVCLASFWTNGVVFGVINSFGVLFVHLMTLPGATAFKICKLIPRHYTLTVIATRICTQ